METFIKETVVEHVGKVASLTEQMKHVEERVAVVDIRVTKVSEEVDKMRTEVSDVKRTLDKLIVRAGGMAAGFTFAVVSLYKGLEFFFKYLAAHVGQGAP